MIVVYWIEEGISSEANERNKKLSILHDDILSYGYDA